MIQNNQIVDGIDLSSATTPYVIIWGFHDQDVFMECDTLDLARKEIELRLGFERTEAFEAKTYKFNKEAQGWELVTFC